jgi:NAD(P)H-dependent FMN reductase
VYYLQQAGPISGRLAMETDGMPSPRPALLIVWWSNTGGTEQLARAAHDAAAQEPAVDARLLRADLAGPQDLVAATAIVFATPECLGSMAGPMKDFFDRTYYPVLDRIVGRPYGTLICAGTDGQGAARQIDRICTGWRLRRVAEPVIVITGAQTPAAILAPKTIDAAGLQRAAELGAALSAGVGLGIW